MKRLPITKESPHPDAIAAAIAVFKQGGIVVYPTDTCYGLGVDARNQPAVRRLIQMKSRNLRAKPFSVIVASIDDITSRNLAQVDDRVERILRRYLPGPFTFILINLDFRISRSSSIGIRIPQCATTSMLCAELHAPYTTTSANVGGLPSAYSYDELEVSLLTPLRQQQQALPDLMLDAGPLKKTAPSTVVDLTSTPARILREGSGTFRELSDSSIR